jgi:putative ABC transport system permease protein
VKFLALAAKNALRSRRRTLLTLCALAASTFLLTGLAAMVRSADVTPGVGELTLSVAGRDGPLPAGQVERIAAMPGVRAVMGFMYAGGAGGQESERVTLAAVDADTMPLIWPDTLDIPRGQYEPFQRDLSGLLAGREAARKAGWKIGDTLTLAVTAGNGAKADMTFRICGFNVEGAWGNISYIHRRYLNESIGRPDYVNSIFLSAAKRGDIPRLMAAIDEAFASSPNPTRTQTHEQSLTDTVATMENLRALLGGISLIVGLAVLLIATNSMALALRARQREFAILRTLGYTPGRVLWIVLAEAGLVGVAAGILGGAVAVAVLQGVALPMNPRAAFSATPAVAATVAAAAVALGLAGAWLPARSACRRRTIDALRSLG